MLQARGVILPSMWVLSWPCVRFAIILPCCLDVCGLETCDWDCGSAAFLGLLALYRPRSKVARLAMSVSCFFQVRVPATGKGSPGFRSLHCPREVPAHPMQQDADHDVRNSPPETIRCPGTDSGNVKCGQSGALEACKYALRPVQTARNKAQHTPIAACRCACPTGRGPAYRREKKS